MTWIPLTQFNWACAVGGINSSAGGALQGWALPPNVTWGTLGMGHIALHTLDAPVM